MACGVVDDEMIDRPLSTDVGASCRGVPMSIGIDFGDIAGAPAATHRAVIPMKGLPKGEGRGGGSVAHALGALGVRSVTVLPMNLPTGCPEALRAVSKRSGCPEALRAVSKVRSG
jgi:hypothetical protein